MLVSRTAKLGAGVAATCCALVLTASPALADGSLSGQTCCDPGGAKVTANADFIGRYHVVVNSIRLTDLCPGDGHSVYVQFQYKNDATNEWVTRGDNHTNSSGCGTTTSETAFDFTATSGRIEAVRLRVCVNETFPNADDCQLTNYRYNQYP